MNFDELQKQWDNQSSEKVKIGNDLDIKTEANTVIDKVRKTLKKDFFFQITIFPILLLFPYYFDMNNQLIWWIVICYCATLIIPFTYIFRFYKRSYRLEYSSLKNINWFYYNYKSSIDVYSIYTYVLCILMIMFVGIVYIQKNTFIHFESPLLLYVYIVSILVIYVVFCIWILKWWINQFYKKPLLELENILNQLEE
ncbi:hypothetical protein [Empedobacter stercoris]|uniref:hypothetical protein n=1 Tax=Empedobacter stercoris TaxID=1628248 RepID=UPI0039EC2013